MICVPENIAVDPIIPGNLQGLRAVRISYQIELSNVPMIMAKFPLQRLSSDVSSAFEASGLKISDRSNAVVNVGVAAQPTLIAQLGGVAAIYAVDVAVREPVSIPRVANDLTGEKTIRTVDTWRGKAITGILLPQSSYDDAAALLFAAAVQQIERLLSAWKGDQVFAPRTRPELDDDDESTTAPDPTDPLFKKIKEKLEHILSGLAVGNDGRATLEKFDVSGTQIEFSAKIRHRHTTRVLGKKVVVYSVTTRTTGSFDISDPASLNVEVCVDKPDMLGGGKVCKKLTELKSLL